MNRPRLLIILSGALDVGGAENQLLATSRDLVSRGFDIQILCLWKRGSLAGEAERNGVEVFAISRSLSKMRGPLAKISRLVGGAFAVAARLRRWRPDLVHFVLPHAYVVGGFASMPFPRPIRIMSRRGMNRYLDGRPVARWQEHFLHRRMHALLANSRCVADELLDEDAPADRLGLIYNGVDLSRFDGLPSRSIARQQLELPADALILVKVSNLWDYKGHADLLQALAGADLGRPWMLLLVGRDEGAKQALQAQAHHLGLESRVRFMGASERVPLILVAADIGVSASHEEGFSNAVVEYLAAGLAVVATDVGGSREAVGGAGLIVPPGDPGALRQALIEVADVKHQCSLSALAKQRAAMFGMDRCVDAYEELYRGLLTTGAVPTGICYNSSGDIEAVRSDTQSSGVA